MCAMALVVPKLATFFFAPMMMKPSYSYFPNLPFLFLVFNWFCNRWFHALTPAFYLHNMVTFLWYILNNFVFHICLSVCLCIWQVPLSQLQSKLFLQQNQKAKKEKEKRKEKMWEDFKIHFSFTNVWHIVHFILFFLKACDMINYPLNTN